MIPLIIMGGILTGWFTPTEAGMIASVYILVVLIPLLNRGHIRFLLWDFVYTGMLYAIPLAAVAGASAFGWMLGYLRGPDIVAAWIADFAGTDAGMIMLLLVLLFVIIGDFVDAVPAIIIFMPIINKLTELGNINPVHMGVVIITTLVFGLITPPYGLSLLVASKFVGVSFARAMFASLPIYVVFFITIAFTVLFPDVVLYLPKLLLPESVGCFKNPSGIGYICPTCPHAKRDLGQRDELRIARHLGEAAVAPVGLGLLDALLGRRHEVPPDVARAVHRWRRPAASPWRRRAPAIDLDRLAGMRTARSPNRSRRSPMVTLPSAT